MNAKDSAAAEYKFLTFFHIDIRLDFDAVFGANRINEVIMYQCQCHHIVKIEYKSSLHPHFMISSIEVGKLD